MSYSLKNIYYKQFFTRRTQLRKSTIVECETESEKLNFSFEQAQDRIKYLFVLYSSTKDVKYLESAKELIEQLESNRSKTKQIYEMLLFLKSIDIECSSVIAVVLYDKCKQLIQVLLQTIVKTRLERLKTLICPIYLQPSTSIDTQIINC